MISVAPKRAGGAWGEPIIGALSRLRRGVSLKEVGEVEAVCQPPGTEGVHPSQVHVCVCCFFKHQLVELPPYPQLAVAESSCLKSRDPSPPWDWLVCAVSFCRCPHLSSRFHPRARRPTLAPQASENVLSSQEL